MLTSPLPLGSTGRLLWTKSTQIMTLCHFSDHDRTPVEPNGATDGLTNGPKDEQ